MAKLRYRKTIVVAVASGNEYKVKAIEAAFKLLFWRLLYKIVVVYHAVPSGVPEQPVGSEQTFQGARNRLKEIKKIYPEADFYVSTEAGIVPLCEGHYGNVQTAIIERKSDGQQGYAQSGVYEIPQEWMDMAVSQGIAAVFALLFGENAGGTRPITYGIFTRKLLIIHAVILAYARYNWISKNNRIP